MPGNIMETRKKAGIIMTTVNEPLSGMDEYVEDLSDYFGDNPNKNLYKNIS